MGFECFPLPYRIFQFVGEFIIGMPPNQITIESKPCHVIQSKTVILTPRVDHYHFSRSVFPSSCLTPERPVLLPGCTLLAPAPQATTGENLAANNWPFNIDLGFSGSECSHLSCFLSPPGPGVGMRSPSAGGSVTK